MIILAIDTAASLCASCVYDSGSDTEKGRAVLDLGKGHAEHVMATVEEALSRAGISYGSLDAVAVSTGPGSFTGVRVGVSAARGLSLALKIPALGVTTLEALAMQARNLIPGRAILTVTGRNPERLNMALFDEKGLVAIAPKLADAEEIASIAAKAQPVLAGEAAGLVADAAGGAFEVTTREATADIAYYARLAARHGPSDEQPKPLYLRPPDAKPQDGFAVPLKAR